MNTNMTGFRCFFKNLGSLILIFKEISILYCILSLLGANRQTLIEAKTTISFQILYEFMVYYPDSFIIPESPSLMINLLSLL